MTADTQPHILVVDDELSMREFLDVMLRKAGYTVTLCRKRQTGAIAMIRQNDYDLLLCDIRLAISAVIEVLNEAKHESILPLSVIMISAYPTTETAVEAMNKGAYDYVPNLSTTKS